MSIFKSVTDLLKKQAIQRTNFCCCSILIGTNSLQKFSHNFTITIDVHCCCINAYQNGNGSNSFFLLRCSRTSDLMSTDKLAEKSFVFLFFFFPSELWLSSFHCPVLFLLLPVICVVVLYMIIMTASSLSTFGTATAAAVGSALHFACIIRSSVNSPSA